MKNKARIIFKSLADLPANLLATAASLPMRVANVSKEMVAVPARTTRREMRAARRSPVEFVRGLEARACAAFRHVTPWARGGINE
jgi:hypothetical protein